jgi:hypothetical protein
MKKIYSLIAGLCFLFNANSITAQCAGTWSVSVGNMNYLCANGPFFQYSLTTTSCPSALQGIFYYTVPQQTVELKFSAFGSVSGPGASRLAIFLNGNKVDLANACSIVLGCQAIPGTYSINAGCLVDATPGSDGGISGSIFLSAAAYSLSSISNIGIGLTEPGSSGTIFQIGACNSVCSGTGINELISSAEKEIVFPNPANGVAYLTIPENAEDYFLSIFDAKGSLIESKNVKGGEKVSFESENGLYFFTLKDTGKNIRKGKFLLQK